MIIDKEAHDKVFNDSVKKFNLEKSFKKAYLQAVMDYNTGGLGRSVTTISVPHELIHKESSVIEDIVLVDAEDCECLHYGTWSRDATQWFKDIVTQYLNERGICESIILTTYTASQHLIFEVKFKINT